MKNISLLGSTGSIGTQSLDVVRKNNFNICALTANKNFKLVEEQAREFKPSVVCMMDENSAKELKIRLSDTDIKVLSGKNGLIECATYKNSNVVLNSVVGMVGLDPTLAAINEKKQ